MSTTHAIDPTSTSASSAKTDEMTLTSNSPKATISLLDLPEELLVNIAERINLADTRNFRLACRKLKAAAQDHFLEVYFKTRHHVLTKSSIETLLAITTEPHLCEVISTVHFYLPSAFWPSEMGTLPPQIDSTDSQAVCLRREMTEWEQKLERLRTMFEAERLAFLKEDCGETMLEDLLHHLAQGTCQSVGLSYATPETPYAYGLKTLEKTLGFDCTEATDGKELFCMEVAQQILLSSLEVSGLAMRSLTLPNTKTWNTGGRFEWEITCPEYQELFLHLEKLELGRFCEYTTWRAKEEDFEYVRTIIAVSSATLTDLTLHLDTWFWKASALSTHSLRNLTICYRDDPDGSKKRLVVEMLQTQRKTLRHFELRVVHHNHQVFDSLLQWIPENLQLDTFTFRWTNEEALTWDDDVPRYLYRFKYEGKEGIAAGAAELRNKRWRNRMLDSLLG